MTPFQASRRQALGWLAATLPAAGALAQSGWRPTQSISYQIGVAPGGSVDLYARGIKAALETHKLVNGQTVITDNKPGAAGLLALQQPAARDLRFITATIKANADLERIGDQAVNVAGNSLRIVGHISRYHAFR